MNLKWLGKISGATIYPFRFFLAIFFLMTACSSPESQKNGLSQDDKAWMAKFLSDLLLEESGIFTLWGTKPMTAFNMYLYSPEEIRELRAMCPPDPEDEVVIVKNYDFPQNWAKWEQNKNRFPLQGFLLFKRDDLENPKEPRIFFINILETALVIQENYALFKRDIREDFDPFSAVMEIEDRNSIFWNKVFENAQLVGLLYGFGLKNASCFDWNYREENQHVSTFSGSLVNRASEKINTVGDATIEHFRLPVFASFFEEDEMKSKYEKERKQIQQIYRHKDFVDTSLQRLTHGQGAINPS